MGFFDRLKASLSKTREKFIDKIDEILHGSTKIDDELLDELEETLITSDVGMATTEKLIAGLRKGVRKAEINSPADVKNFLSTIKLFGAFRRAKFLLTALKIYRAAK